MEGQKIRRTLDIAGVVQGVGFRPTLHRLASEAGIGGSVQNRSGTVRLVLEGERGQLDEFLQSLPKSLPGASSVDSVELVSEEEFFDEFSSSFRILESETKEAYRVSFPPDLAMCNDCRAEISDPADRRFGYAFTTCTNCGPRYTVINNMPYDRERTTLAEFPLCDDCESEYQNPDGRRFHAESIACSKCGPRLWLLDAKGQELSGDALMGARAGIASGSIVALRGVGGFLLAVDAGNRETVQELRIRKNRPHKPFAVMVRSLEVLEEFCFISPEQEKLLLSQEAPIVILDLKPGSENLLPLDLLSPDTSTLGAMLPYSPLHTLLFSSIEGDNTPVLDVLVMTSGNRRSEPICIKNDEALSRLEGIADFYLCHDREINLRADDSLCAVQDSRVQVWRRARGYTPGRLSLSRSLKRSVLAMGAELKNAIALGHSDEIMLSPHIGDLETPEALSGLEQVVECFPEFFRVSPEVVAIDLHPDMRSSMLGRKIAKEQGFELVEVQHHYAHAASCMAEHRREESLALVFDGTGLGTDGSIWGAELLHVKLDSFLRLASFSSVPLPGGDSAVREPRRQVFGRFLDAGVEFGEEELRRFNISADEARIWTAQVKRGINAPLSHAAGRVFDSFSALLGFSPEATTYDGQAAVRLETAARKYQGKLPELEFSACEKEEMLFIDWRDSFISLLDKNCGLDSENNLAMAVHEAIARAALRMVEFGLSKVRSRAVVLSGGVFMNRILTSLVCESLEKKGIEVLIHHEVPPNDGGIAVGQAYIAGR